MATHGYAHDQCDWDVFVHKLYHVQTNIVNLLERVLFNIEWPAPHVDVACMHDMWTPYIPDFVRHLRTLSNDEHEKWCNRSAKRLVQTLNRSVNLYLEIIFYYHSYTEHGAWIVHTQTLTPNIRHLTNILRNDIIACFSGPLPINKDSFTHTMIYDLTIQIFVCWICPCTKQISCLSKDEFTLFQLSFAMITHNKLAQKKHAIHLDTHIVQYIFSLVFNRSCFQNAEIQD